MKLQKKEYATETMSLETFLKLAQKDSSVLDSAAQRMLKAIGEPVKMDTSKDPRLSRIFGNRTVRKYEVFADFYGLEDVVSRIISFFQHAAQNLEESRQILYLLGPVGSAKSSLVERLKTLMEKEPIYILADSEGNPSPLHESPLGVCGADILAELGISVATVIPSPWATKRLKEYKGDLSKFNVIKRYPSQLEQVAISKTEPGDENNQDISALVGKVDIRKLEHYAQNDADAYSFCGGLCLSNQGILEFVEMFKAPIKMLHPLLTATQERNYKGTEAIPAIPFQGIIIAHCFSEDTEILTQEGWKFHNEIEVGDKLLTLNTETNIAEYQPALQKYEFEHDGIAYHFNNVAADHIVTGNHGMITKTQYTDHWRKTLAADIQNTGSIMPVSALTNVEDFPISDEVLRLQVWVTADGNISYKGENHFGVRFGFVKDRKVERLSALLDKMGVEYNKRPGNNGKTYITKISFRVSVDTNKRLPNYFKYLSSRQGLIVLEEYGHTDGHISVNSKYNHMQLSSNQKDDINILQQIAVTSGYKTTISEHVKERHTPQYILSLKQVTEHRMDYAKTAVYYKGKVFCFETKNHTLVARRNGKVLFTNNSNESEWDTFKNNKNNEAFLDRVYSVEVPYCLQIDEEQQIYKKLLNSSTLKDAPTAPYTLDLLAQFSVLTRIEEPENSNVVTKMRVYNGENVKEKDSRAKSYQEYKDLTTSNEGFSGISTRLGYKILAEVYNFDFEEIAANPVHLLYVLEKTVLKARFSKDVMEKYLEYIKEYLVPYYAAKVKKDINEAYLDSYDEFGQALFDRYIVFADHWIQDNDYRDVNTGQMYDREMLNKELEKIEKPAEIANPKDFRHEIVNFCLREQAKHNGKNPNWKSYEKLKRVIEATMFAKTQDLLPVISFSGQGNKSDKKKHDSFITRMMELGYTEKQVRIVVEWQMRVSNS